MASSFLKRALVRALVLAACQSALLGQIGQRPGSDYPPGQHPGRYPGGAPLPSPRTGKKLPGTQTKQPPKPAKHVTGAIRTVQEKSFVMEASDKRIITVQVSAQTQFVREGRLIAFSDLRTGDPVEVEAQQDEAGNFLALHVTLQTGAQQEQEREAASVAHPGSQSSRATVAPAVPDAGDPGPPTLKRGKPPASINTKSNEALPAKAPATSTPLGTAAAASPAPAETPPTPPPREQRAELVEKARAAAQAFSTQLPNYVCQQFTTRYASRSRPARWEPRTSFRRPLSTRTARKVTAT